jgi:hypothetical protein
VIIKNNENKVGKVDDDDEDEDLFASKDDPFKLFGNKAAPKMVRCTCVVMMTIVVSYYRLIACELLLINL